ncbi:MFS transporter [Plantibacter flavus]
MATFVDGMALTGIGTALVLYQQSVGLTPNEVGLLTGISTAAVAAGALAGGRLGDQLGRRRVFLVTMALIVIGAGLAATAPQFGLLAIAVALFGLGVGADLPVSLATISEAASDKNRAKIIIFSNVLGTLGIATAILTTVVAGGLGGVGGQILFGGVAAIGLVTFVLRLTVPESRSWSTAKSEQTQGIRTIRADTSQIRDLFRKPYRRATWTLLIYYSLTTLAVTIGGSFGTYVAVNVAKVDIQQYSAVSLLGLPAAILAALCFMRVADTSLRMPFYVVGAIGVVASYLVPAVFGFTFVTVIVSVLLVIVAGAFCYETMMKVWTQESFPVLIRSTAQGLVYGTSRIAAALLAVVTPALLTFNPRGLYIALALVSMVGLLVGYLGFRRSVGTAFDHEDEADPESGTVPTSTVDAASPTS